MYQNLFALLQLSQLDQRVVCRDASRREGRSLLYGEKLRHFDTRLVMKTRVGGAAANGTHTDTIPRHQSIAVCAYPCNDASTFNAYRSGIVLYKENKQVAEVDTRISASSGPRSA